MIKVTTWTNTANKSRNRLTMFIGMSVVLHAIALLWYDPGPLPAFTQASGGPIRLKLVTSSETQQPAQVRKASALQAPVKTQSPAHPPRTMQQPLAKSAPIRPDNQSKRTEGMVAPRALTAPHTIKADTDTQTQRTETPPERASDNQETQQALLVYIQGEISKHFSYPRLARQRGWQGQVMLGFNVNKHGNIDKVHVRQSSGFAILDQAAKRSLSQVKFVTGKDRFIDRSWSGLQLPVIYRLQES